MLLTASRLVGVEDEVTVSAVKVAVRGGIHRRQVAFLHTPDLKRSRGSSPPPPRMLHTGLFLAHAYLHLPLAVIHHAVLGGHGVVGVQLGGVEGDLLHFGDPADGVSLTGTSRLVSVSPVREELLEESRLPSSRQHLDLQKKKGHVLL